MSKKKKSSSPLPKPIKLDLSHGTNPQAGFERKILADLRDNSVEEIFSAFLFQRIPHDKRPKFMDECYRVLIPGGKMTVVVPYWSSARAVQDFTAEWPPLTEQSFNYFNKAWRDAQKYDEPHGCEEFLGSPVNPPLKCDFDVAGGYIFDQETATRSDDVRSAWVKHNINAVTDLQMVLTKRG